MSSGTICSDRSQGGKEDWDQIGKILKDQLRRERCSYLSGHRKPLKAFEQE